MAYFRFKKLIYLAIGWIEILIGLITLIGSAFVQACVICSLPPKPDNVYMFVVISAAISFILGIGLIFGRNWARFLLIFFSGYIILTKVLIYSGLMAFSGPIVSIVPVWVVDGISSTYHTFIICLLCFLDEPA